MSSFRISLPPRKEQSAQSGKVLFSSEAVRAEGLDPFHSWKSESGEDLFAFGTVIGSRNSDGSLAPASKEPKSLALLGDPGQAATFEGRFVIVRIAKNGSVEVWTDQFGKKEVYFQTTGDETVIASDLGLLPVAHTGASLDQVAAAHSLTVYGSRPPKKHTFYDGVRRLGTGEILRVGKGSVEVAKDPFTPKQIVEYGAADLDRYFETFAEAIRSRASADLNLVSLSSGWDSTSILGMIVHLYGKKKVRAVIARLTYAERSGVINQFEIDRAAAVAAYYSVPLDIVEYDFGANGARYFAEAKNVLRSNQLMSLSGLGNHRMYAHVAKTYPKEAVFFTGEGSDGAHNFGFSQLVTMFHPVSHEFREYADKMATFLYGPSFIRELYEGTEGNDPVWNLIRGSYKDALFDKPEKTPAKINQQLLHSLFLRNNRTPFYSLRNSTLLTEKGREKYEAESDEVYFKDLESFQPDNAYSWYLHLYNSFYWQSTPVKAREIMADTHGVKIANPFQDSALVDFLAAMPESWGRGLNLNSTKYPLKWVLSNKIDYPVHFQVGPHSYTYDVQPGFSISGELLHASSLSDVFKDALRENSFGERLDPELFDRKYLDRVTKSYVDGTELRGEDAGVVFNLATHSAVGLYDRS